jgi:hypothetical protein
LQESHIKKKEQEIGRNSSEMETLVKGMFAGTFEYLIFDAEKKS